MYLYGNWREVSWSCFEIEKRGYGVNIHDTKMSYVQENSKQRNSALIAVLHLKVTVRPSTQSENSAPHCKFKTAPSNE